MPFRRTPGPRLISLYSSYTCHSKDEFMYIYTSPIYKQQKQQSFHMFRPLMWTRETNEWQQHTRSKVKGSSLGCCGEHKHTHTPSIIQQRVDERACSCGWRTGMGGCWESERGCRARGRETDNKRPALPQSSKEPFQQSVYQSKRAYGVHTVCIRRAYAKQTSSRWNGTLSATETVFHTEPCSLLWVCRFRNSCCKCIILWWIIRASHTHTGSYFTQQHTPRDKTNILTTCPRRGLQSILSTDNWVNSSDLL